MKVLKSIWILPVFLLIGVLPVFSGGKKDAPSSGAAANGPEQPVKIRFAIQPGNVHILAKELGYFEKEGLDVEISTFSYGPPIIEAIASKSVDFGLLGDLPVFSGIANGIDITIPAIASSSYLSYGIIARKASGVQTLGDLKGKKIALPFGSNVQPLLHLYLEKAGVKETEIELINLSAIDAVGAILAGQVDAAVIWDPYLTIAVLQSQGSVSLLATAEGYKLFANPVIARGEFTAKYPEQTVKFFRALNATIAWVLANEEEGMKILAEVSEVPLDVIKINLPKSDITLNLTQERIDAIVSSAAQSYKYGLLTQEIDVASHIDSSFLKAAGVQ
jgi:aliphatic sulfonates family ABC transporter substrate-binding protein